MLSKATGKLVNFGRKQHRKASPRIPASGMRNSPEQSPDSGDFYAAAKAWQLESDCVHRGRPIEWSTQIMRLRQQIFSPSTAHTVGADDGGKCTLGTSSFQGRRHEKIADHCEPISLDWWPHVDENTCNRVAFPPFPPLPHQSVGLQPRSFHLSRDVTQSSTFFNGGHLMRNVTFTC